MEEMNEIWGKSMTLECMTLKSFEKYLEKLIRSIKKRNEIKSNKNKQ